MEIKVLGPVEIWAGGELLQLPRRQMSLVLGLLALVRPDVVLRDRLVEFLWPQEPPRRAPAVLQTRISELRSSLRDLAVDDAGIAITSQRGGYRLEVPAEAIDAGRFESMVRSVPALDSLDRACGALRSALDLWRGPVLGGTLGGDVYAAVSQPLESLRLTAAEDLFALELHRGNASGVLDDVLALSALNPTRERLFAELVLALHASGRSNEALRRYDDWRRSLRDDLGVDPGAGLRALHLAILNEDVDVPTHTRVLLPPETRRNVERAARRTSTGADGALAPRTLPPDIADFAGRDGELQFLITALTRTDGGTRAMAVTGPGGIGKSAICTRAAHALSGAFPEGQIYLNLHGFDREATLEPWTALGRMLRLLGVEEPTIPKGMDERVELYRQLTAHRTLLVVLDNAASDDQLLPLLPGGTNSRALINGRNRLGASFGATAMALDVLQPNEAGELLAQIVGPRRLECEPEAVNQLVVQCGGLPLALRIVAARLAGKPHWNIARIVGQLADERSKLNQLSYAHLDVRTTISLSYRGLEQPAKALLRRVCDLGLPDVTVAVAAAVLDVTPVAAEQEMETLFDAQFFEAAGQDSAGFPRYRVHDLVRLFARERAGEEESPTETRAVRRRVLGHYLSVADAAFRGVSGGGFAVPSAAPRWTLADDLLVDFVAAPIRWFEIERANIAVMVGRAAEFGEVAACWDVACTTSQLFAVRQYADEWAALIQRALAAAAVGDILGQAAVRHRLAILYGERRDFSAARQEIERSEELFDQIDHDNGRGLAAAYLGSVERFTGQPAAAIGHYRRALATFQRTGDVGNEAFARRGIGQAEMDRGRYDAADQNLERALQLYRSLDGVQVSLAQVLFWRGMLFTRQARFGEAEELFTEVMMITRQFDDPTGQAQALRGLAICQHERDDKGAAAASFEAALRLVEKSTYIVGSIQSTIDDLGYRDLIAIELQTPAAPARS